MQPTRHSALARGCCRARRGQVVGVLGVRDRRGSAANVAGGIRGDEVACLARPHATGAWQRVPLVRFIGQVAHELGWKGGRSFRVYSRQHDAREQLLGHLGVSVGLDDHATSQQHQWNLLHERVEGGERGTRPSVNVDIDLKVILLPEDWPASQRAIGVASRDQRERSTHVSELAHAHGWESS